MAEHILGIDFGTTNSVMAWYDEKAGRPQVISNAEGEEKTPSVVYYAPEGVIVGRGAEMALVDAEFLEEPERSQVLQATFCSVKRDLGKHLLHALPDGRPVSPVEIASEVFKKLKTDAEELFFHEPVKRAVVTHPAAFSPSQRKAIEEAALLGGFEQVTLLEEPVAAALGQMAQGSAVGQGVIVYDLGGGTFDLAYVQRDGAGFRSPLPCLGLPRCGGDDIDQQIYDTLDEKAHELGMSLYHADGSLSQAALRECRKGKEQLSSLARSGISIMIPEVHSQSKRYFVERGELEGLMGELVENTVKQTQELIRRVEQAGLPLEEVILIGGSTRAPLIAQKLQQRLPQTIRLSKTMYADHAVALGAAAQQTHPTSISTSKPAPQPEPEPEAEPEESANDGPMMRTIKRYLKSLDWHYEQLNDRPILTSTYEGDHGQWDVFLLANEETCRATFLSRLKTKIPEAKRAAVNEYLARANFGMTLGAFEMDFEDGEIRFRLDIDVEGNTLREKQVGILFLLGVTVVDKYLPGLMAVTYANKPPKEACQQAEAQD
jgi:hypothetical protein